MPRCFTKCFVRPWEEKGQPAACVVSLTRWAGVRVAGDAFSMDKTRRKLRPCWMAVTSGTSFPLRALVVCLNFGPHLFLI